MNLYKLIPFIPVVGIPLTVIAIEYDKLNDFEENEFYSSMVVQAISLTAIFFYLQIK